jgi:formylglycine-generating enzyme required for sulfatase activity
MNYATNCSRGIPDQIGWYCGNNDPPGTKEEAQKQPNAGGLYDMTGSVREWYWDRSGSYPTEPVADPTGPEAGPTPCGTRRRLVQPRP